MTVKQAWFLFGNGSAFTRLALSRYSDILRTHERYTLPGVEEDYVIPNVLVRVIPEGAQSRKQLHIDMSVLMLKPEVRRLNPIPQYNKQLKHAPHVLNRKRMYMSGESVLIVNVFDIPHVKLEVIVYYYSRSVEPSQTISMPNMDEDGNREGFTHICYDHLRAVRWPPEETKP